jgi:hypothetical protein
VRRVSCDKFDVTEGVCLLISLDTLNYFSFVLMSVSMIEMQAKHWLTNILS